jgi:hypothetical protein
MRAKTATKRGLDTLDGGADGDLLFPGDGKDAANGGDGADTFIDDDVLNGEDATTTSARPTATTTRSRWSRQAGPRRSKRARPVRGLPLGYSFISRKVDSAVPERNRIRKRSD